MAAVTRHLGFGLTANLTYEAPYLFARRMSTLDHLSRGRVGWNIVTGYLDSAAKAMGLNSNRARPPLRPGRRIPAGAVQTAGRQLGRRRRGRRPRAARLCAPDKVHKVSTTASSTGRGLPPVRALAAAHPGAVPGRQFARGLAFAGNHAECVFISGQDKAATRAQVDKVRAAAQAAGRDPQASRCSWAST
jgi:alkanesulfonate monooxygenase SsuD/methylene tetrahydromethanopterin reductase-like flavin-dependent oxidoreductase (luciferase family)